VQFVSVQLTVDTLRDAITVPSAAVQQGPKGSFVYVVQGDTVQLRPVEIAMSDDVIAAVQGLKEGEQVVTDGHLRLTPGAKVKVTNVPTQP
jgi:multidrug efflux system membrane fusion protein